MDYLDLLANQAEQQNGDETALEKLEKTYDARAFISRKGLIGVVSTGKRHVAPCLYIRVPKKYANKIEKTVYVHGGFTYKEPASDKKYTWLGWDYGHSGDYLPFLEEEEVPEVLKNYNLGKHRWSDLELGYEIKATLDAVDIMLFREGVR